MCVLDHVFDKKELHNAHRDENGSKRKDFRFTSVQLAVIQTKVTELKVKYQLPPWNENVVAINLVISLTNFIAEIAAEQTFEEMMEVYELSPSAVLH